MRLWILCIFPHTLCITFVYKIARTKGIYLQLYCMMWNIFWKICNDLDSPCWHSSPSGVGMMNPSLWFRVDVPSYQWDWAHIHVLIGSGISVSCELYTQILSHTYFVCVVFHFLTDLWESFMWLDKNPLFICIIFSKASSCFPPSIWRYLLMCRNL